MFIDDGQKLALSAKPQRSEDCFVVIGNQQWPILRRHVDLVLAAVNAVMPGSYLEVDIPFV